VSGHRLALIVANDEYEQVALRDLPGPRADAEALGRVLGDPDIGHFAVQVVRNEPSYVIQAKIEELFSESRPEDVLLLHFSCHGLKSESGELFFAAANTRPKRLESTAVSADFVQRCMRASRSRSAVLLLDCCYGGAFAHGSMVRAAGDVNVLDSFPQGRLGGGRGRAVITASNAMEYAFEGDQLAEDQRQRPSVFTSALVEGLATGDADRDEDGWISLDELYDYVFDKVQEQNPHQTPSRHVELEGELYLARSQRRRIRPAPIPPDLQAAISDPNIYTRRGAVSELQVRLASDDLPVAAGAHQALVELAHTDIQYVAELAAAALRQAAVRPEKTELNFGQLRQGAAPLHRSVRLLGPHIARACAPHSSDDWIRVNATPEGFDVTVDTTRAGPVRGNLYLKGLTGEAVIAIEAEILPRAAPASTIPRPRRPAPQPATPVAVPAGQPVDVPTAKRGQEAPQAAGREAAAQGGQHAAEATQPQAAMPPTTAPAVTSAARPTIRMGAAYAGTVIALLAGIGGLISQVLGHDSSQSGAIFLFNLAVFAIPVVTAVIALTQIRRLVIIGLLQGMSWQAIPSLAASTVIVAHLSGLTGRHAAGGLLSFTSYALEVIAAILLMVAWSPVVDERRTPQMGAFPVMLLSTVGLSQIAALIFYVTLGHWINSDLSLFFFILGSVGVLVGLAVTWYAVALRARALGGALVLGWVTVGALLLASIMALSPPGTLLFWSVLACVLLAAAAGLAVFYMRGPSDDAAPALLSGGEAKL
jgi:caspase domain-containing protein